MRLFKFRKPQSDKTDTHSAFIAHKEPPLISNFIERCLKPEFTEIIDNREWNFDHTLKKVVDDLNSEHYDLVVSKARHYSTLPEYKDFVFLYYWWGKALLKMNSFDEARRVLREGLQTSKKKHPLLNTLGEVEWKARNVEEAVYWWAQGMHCQESLNNYGGSVDAYLYLYYVAEGAEASSFSPSVFLTMRVDQIRPGQVRLNASTAADLINLTRSANAAQITEVLGQLVRRYLVPKQNVASRADPFEIDLLITQLLHGRDEEQVQAARKLGNLGDIRAIEPLMRTKRNTLSLQLQVDAEEAINKIKVANH